MGQHLTRSVRLTCGNISLRGCSSRQQFEAPQRKTFTERFKRALNAFSLVRDKILRENLPKDAYTLVMQSSNTRYLASFYVVGWCIAIPYVWWAQALVRDPSPAYHKQKYHKKPGVPFANFSMGTQRAYQGYYAMTIASVTGMMMLSVVLLRRNFFRIYKINNKPGSFLGVQRDLLLRVKCLKFTSQETVEYKSSPAVQFFIGNMLGNIKIQGRRFFVAPRQFKSTAAFNEMMNNVSVYDENAENSQAVEFQQRYARYMEKRRAEEALRRQEEEKARRLAEEHRQQQEQLEVKRQQH